jgi:hypothetical protein
MASISSPSPRWPLPALHILSAAALQVRLCGRARLLFPSDACSMHCVKSHVEIPRYSTCCCFSAWVLLSCRYVLKNGAWHLELILASCVRCSIHEETWYWLPRSFRYRVGGFLSTGEALAGGVVVILNLARACILAKRLAHLKHKKRTARSNSSTLAAALASVSAGPGQAHRCLHCCDASSYEAFYEARPCARLHVHSCHRSASWPCWPIDTACLLPCDLHTLQVSSQVSSQESSTK